MHRSERAVSVAHVSSIVTHGPPLFSSSICPVLRCSHLNCSHPFNGPVTCCDVITPMLIERPLIAVTGRQNPPYTDHWLALLLGRPVYTCSQQRGSETGAAAPGSAQAKALLGMGMGSAAGNVTGKLGNVKSKALGVQKNVDRRRAGQYMAGFVGQPSICHHDG